MGTKRKGYGRAALNLKLKLNKFYEMCKLSLIHSGAHSSARLPKNICANVVS